MHVFSHIRTRYFSEGSVQQHPPPYSFRKKKKSSRTARYKEDFFPLENQGKKGSLRLRASW